MTDPVRLLIVGDNADDRSLMSLLLHRALDDVVVDEADGPIAFAEYLAGGRFTAAVVDEVLSWGDGPQVLGAIRRRDPNCLLFMMVESGEPWTTPRRLRDLGLAGYIAKDSTGFLALPEMVSVAVERAASQGQPTLDPVCRRLVRELPVGVLSLNRDGVVTQANQAAAGILGRLSDQALVGGHFSELLRDPDLQANWAALVDQDRAIEGEEARVRLSDGSDRWIRVYVWPVREAAGVAIIGYDAVLLDVSAAKQIDRQLSVRAEALERSNEDLEQLAFAVSHDLQEPLQLVSRHAQLLGERYRDRLGEDAERFLGHLTRNADRMQDMVDGVLKYFRAGRPGRPAETVSFAAAMDEAVANLGSVIEESGARVEYGELPDLPADRLKIVQLFQSLIGNAIKFHGGEPPRVVISAREQEEDWQFAVKDNGIGIEPENYSRIFGMFQRLHTAEEYPGTGIGLAMCKRIVERGGGKIWLGSVPGRGTTFYFTIPKAPLTQGFDSGAEGDEQTPN